MHTTNWRAVKSLILEMNKRPRRRRPGRPWERVDALWALARKTGRLVLVACDPTEATGEFRMWGL